MSEFLQMAMDGSFSLESALERFLTRCPKLATIDKLQRFVEAGHTVTEEEVVKLLAELFLNPNYTIPLIGSFRPVARKIVDQAVALLRNCNLSSDSDDIEGDFVDADVLYVIEHYERSGRGLELHELACLAFCRALDLDHSLLGSVTTYFKFAPPPFERISRNKVVSEDQLFQAANHYLLAVRISYRLLLMQPEFFSEQWNWSCFLDHVKKLVNLDLFHVAKDAKAIADIKWCGIQILCTILGMSDKAVENFGVGAEEATLCLLRWEEFCQDVAIEKFCLCVGSSEQTNFGSFTGGIKFGQQNFLKSCGLNSLISSHCHQIEPVIKSRRVVTWDERSTAYPFVVTSMMSKGFEMVLLAVSQKWPVLLYGPPGAGKTALINKLAQDAGNQVLSIHMDDQIDGKTLIGSYVCTEQPGEFRWQPGSLIQAVLNGYWVVFEDIDKAPSDVQSILLPLLEGEIAFITSHGEEIRVAESFQLFSTITTSKSNVSHTAEVAGGSSLSTLWRRVMIGLPSNDDLENIMKAWYPSLGPLTGRLIETMERVNPSPSGNSACLSCLNRFSLRDLLKWCKRIAELGLNGDMLTAYQCHLIYQEAVDIFASFSAPSENRLTVMRDIAKLWGVPISEAGILYPCKPEIQNLFTELRIGRVTLQRTETVVHGQEKLVEMRSSLYVLEQIACAVKYNEPILLVGETGTGKTTLVQNLAMMLGQKLTVLNLSQQSDVADLLGGFKPIDSLSICIPLYKEFEILFSKTFSMKENDKIFAYLQKQMKNKNWKTLLNGFKKYVDNFQKKLQTERSGSGKKRKKPLDENIRAWESFSVKLEAALRQIEASSGMLFSFVEGSFITALRNGEWILLDEVNLAPPETLQRVIGVLEGEYGSLCLAERGDVSHIPRNPSFRIFACMNPATDAGKRDLPYSLQSRFTAYFVHDVLDRDDLKLFINKFMEESISNIELEKKIIDFYEAAKKNSEERLQDGANQKPQYSLRSLYRALEYTRGAKGKFGFPKAIYDGFCMFFLTMLDRPSAKIMKKMIKEKLLGGNKPSPVPFDAYLRITKISGFDDLYKNYVLTKSVKKQLENLARAVFIKRYPVLLQGPTSSGKTSLVQYLAARTGHEFVRINNHEHTDLQEYLGSYISDAQGKLVFQEGILVKAVRNGHWIVLDELNLAPSDVLEALNRLLDDNRELFLPELRETVRAHPNFMLFATQNPPTFYGGRKMLSRAFRNRFVEVHVDEIPDDELSTIIEKRCKIPGSRARLMVEVMKELQFHRQSSKVFAGKHGFITPRDLFRWANRLRAFGDSKEVMAEHGYYLLADRLRDERERHVVQEVLERRLRVKIVRDHLYKESVARESESIGSDLQSLGDVILTRSMRRLYFLVKRCFELREPVLLVGETGGGKTTVCQLLSRALGLKLHILNCHQYTETSDFIGGFFPVRERSRLASEFKYIIEKWMLSKAYTHFAQDLDLSSDIGQASSTLDHLNLIITSYRQGQVSCPNVSAKDIDTLEQMKWDLTCLLQKWQTIFMWQDGPLVQAMKAGDLFLVDEISLADDSVLERLNSVLEPERKLSLAEKGGPVMENITAHENFFVLATMNPGGDYGKKELSPALRNRFTEIWVPPVCDLDELGDIASKRLSNPELSYIVGATLKFWEWFNKLEKGRALTVRDLLSWIQFIMVTKEGLGPDCAFLHGLFLVLLDGISLGTGISRKDAGLFRETCLSFLLKELKEDSNLHELSFIENYGWGDLGETGNISCSDDMQCDNSFGIDPFYIEKGYEKCEAGGFEFLTPTTRRNALRVLRAMQLPKPVLLEGSPGVGKTSLIIALGKYSGHKVVRINLSEQTDLMDLLGTDLPVESDEGMKFAWSDGILLQALKEGCWVLLDELNLAPQSVLEGLNAILDHRAEVFIPELSLTFKCPSSFRIFACQNPFSQGGGRKGLPKSFLNRFTKVYIDELVEGDYLSICNSLYPSIPRPLLSKLIVFNKRLHEDTMLYHKFGQDGSPWEFNLRDVIRSCQIIEGVPEKLKVDCFLNILYVQRMRTAADRKEVLRIYEEVFGVKPFINPHPRVQLNSKYLIVGNTVIKRNISRSSKLSNSGLNIIPSIRHSMEAVVHCIKHQWLCILVGPPCSGKTSLIRLLAQLTGNVLNELSLSTTTDISELLGCFEQYNAFRNFRSVIAQVERYVSEYCNLQLEFSKVAFMSERTDLITKWLAFLSTMNSSSMASSTSIHLENWESMMNSLSLLVEIIQQMKLDIVQNELPFSWSTEELNKTIKVISKLQDDQQRRSRSVKFEWVAGLLIKAIENGEWIVLENANLCNPTVLDRINSLVEPSGSITVNECGIVDGSSVVLHPHHNFRIFLTVNPSHGEVSRAMRNRGVEIFMMPPYWLHNDESGCSGADFELKDVKRFLVSSGIPMDRLVDSMAKAHVYAKNEGLHVNVQITYLELAHWVQLFHQLLINGNQPFWSLQLSWEHTYLSSLGEAVGWDIVNHAKVAYFSTATLSESDLPTEFSFYLPGGLPVPMKLRDFMWYSKEASVRQNLMYLEYLVSQYELGSSRNRSCVDDALSATSHKGNGLMDMNMKGQLVFPKALNCMNANSVRNTEIDMKLTKRMLLFAANWTIEQATGSDYKLYLLHFSWFSSKLQSCDNFFRSFLHLLEQELEHPIWKCIFHSFHELASLPAADSSLHLTPLLSLDFVDLTMSYDRPEVSHKFLCNAINCIDLLRLSYQQWNAQSEHEYTNEAQHFKPVLDALQELEKEILNMLVESPSYNVLIKLYSDILEDHLTFWDVFTSSRFEKLPFSWHSLMKDVLKLRDFCPGAVDNLFMIAENIDKKLNQHSQQSLLWIHGGHPILPASAELFKQQQLFIELCESVWPTKANPYNQGDDCLVELATSSTPELRFLAVQGICMSAYITSRFDEDSGEVALHLADMSQMLLKRFEYEKSKLEAKLKSVETATIEGNSISCCDFSPEARCTKPGFACWLETRPIIDNTSFFLDMDLLQKLSMIVLVDHKECQLALGSVSNLIESAMKHSLTFSTRPPQNFIPHQKILWTLDAWMSVDAVNAKIASYVLEMWFWWHSSLWSHCPVFSENFGKVDGYHTPLPDMLVQSVRTASVVQSLRRTCAIKDYSVHCLKLKAASCNLWQSSLPGMDLSSFLLSVTRSLFQQIIYAHRKAFDADKFAAIKSIFCSFHKNVATQDDIQRLVSILGSSNHQKLNSLVSLFIEPILKKLYLHCSSTEVYLNMGHACLKIGALRFSLLLSCDDFDPAMKYSFKHSQLEERISSLELEIKVRQECDYLAGRLSSIEADKKRADSLERLEFERRRIQKKMVFRCNPLKFNALRKECGEFLKPARMVVGLVDNIEGMDLQQVLEQASNWQATATSFIDRLSDEYKEYIDLAQPFQVAVYEMKLGLSLVLSFALLKKVLNRIKEDNMDRVMESIYSFMRFPRVRAFVPSSSHSIGSPATFWDREMGFLEKLNMLSSEVTTEKMGSILQLKTGLYQNIVVRVAHFVADARRIDDASFKILDKMFHEFANMWMNMKVQVKCKEGDDAQQYKFRPRALEIKSIVDVDFSTLDQFFPNDSFSEWQEFLSEEESLEKLEASKHESVQDEWNLMQETIMKNMICIHNQLFGSTNLVLYAGTCHVVEADRLHSFTNSYTLGVGMIEGLGGLLTSSLDGKLIPEHLLRLCLEHGSKLVSSQKSSANYNFYKDSNAPMMAKMVKLVANLQQQIHSFLSEWEDHPGLQKITDTIQMLLAIPVETPLAKALLGLQFLLNRARALQENESKFPLSDQLEPISALVCSWQKMEFDSWPALLHEVQEQYDINAGKLWFPLFSVLHHSHFADIAGYEQSTIESLEEFIRTSSIGEFRARLQLLFSLHGQITAGRCLEVQNYSSMRQEKNLQILYNVFGYYIQFLPRILEDIEANRKGIEMELKDILKLFHWERTEICLSVENSKRTRQKLRKLILKYTDLLQQPVMLILDREAQQKGPKIHSLQFPKALKDNKNTISDLTQFCEKDRSIWLADWRKKVTDTLQDMHFKNTLGLSFLDNKDVTSITRQCLASHSSHLSRDEQWNVLCWTVEKIFKTAMDCDDLWNDTGKGVGKKRALSELLKLLDTSGLHKHKFEIMKISNSSNWLFIQPSYNAQHLLLTPSRLSGEAFDVSTSSELQCLPDDYVDTMWKSANEFYFKSVASVQFMQRICLKPHGDITYDQASRAVSFLNHLIIIQQSQRAAAYGFSKQLKCLRECTYAFENSYVKCTDIDERTSSEYSIVQNQHAFFQCMWKQKQLFDGLTTLLAEESLLLRTVESTHLKSCRSVRPAANHVLQFIEKFIPVTQKSKESLDNYLLGPLGGLQSLLQESLDKSLLGRVVTISAGPSRPYIISKQMEQLVYKNFQVIKEFEEHFFDFRKQDWNRSFIIETLLGHFDDVFKEGKMLADQFEAALKQRSQSRDSSEEVDYNSGNNYQLEADFDSALKKAHNLVMEALEKQISPGDGGALSEESLENISSWEYLFKSSVQSLNVEELCDILLNIITCAKKMVDHSGSETSHISFHIGRCFQHLHLLLELILGFCDGLLQDLLAMHKTVSIMTRELANVLASLFSKGFGIPVKDEVDEASHDTSQTASGTGMGEGSGLNDVSDQITDEDQLLGTSEKPGDEQDASGEVPNKNEKGIEMEDLTADTFSVSDDSGEDNEEDGEDEQLDSAMGEAGLDSEVVDEKLQNKDEDDNPNNTNERYESGPSVRDNDTSSRELRAKEDSAAIADDEPGEPDKQNNEIGNQDDLDDGEENTDDMNMDKEAAFTDPTGLKLDESNQGAEEDMEMDEDMNEEGDLDSKEEISPEEGDESAEHGNYEEDNTISADETMEEPDSEPVDGTSVKDEPGRDREERSETNAMEPRKDEFELGISDLISDHVHGAESATQPNGPSQASDSKNATAEANMSNISEAHNDLALRSFPSGNTSQNDLMVSDSSNSGGFTNDKKQAQFPERESSSDQRAQPNPYRNVGDALEEWKERVKVSVDLPGDTTEASGEIEDKNADDYAFVSEFEKGTDQALGPATSEQVESNVNVNRSDEDSLAAQRDEVTKMEIEERDAKEWHLNNSASILKNKMEEQLQISDFKSEKEGSPEVQDHDGGDPQNLPESAISVRKSYLSEDVYQPDNLRVDDDDLGKAQGPEEVPLDVKSSASALWSRYELRTTRLSQELAEQLRLVLEPTVASKLQGDYKTGKRINMKKVIPYIASHYRKDKIWLRRTRPNKRDYQVVIAVDDSRSMSESCCGDVAIEALVTVCRAMSQLEMGNMAVASFGKKGNIRSLHDFDQPFTGEAGKKIISSLTFKQENTIADEPVVDLLKYLNNMLDAAVAKARLPSGQNPLQQLVLIIADGRFHEKEKLKRCVRDFLSRKRMVAFLVLDSPQESIMDQMEASFVGEGEKRVLKFTKYLDSFPFPYYIVLKNIEALPRTLADLLRQWFELMQYSRE